MEKFLRKIEGEVSLDRIIRILEDAETELSYQDYCRLEDQAAIVYSFT